MRYRTLQRTGWQISEVGLGGEHFTDKDPKEAANMMDAAIDSGINILDVYMPYADVRSLIGDALKGRRDKMILQGHVGSMIEDDQYKRTRNLEKSKAYIEDFMKRFHTDYIDIGMLHYVDSMDDWNVALDHGLIDYMVQQKKAGTFRALGVSSHNPVVAQEMVKAGMMDVLMFSISPLFDLVLNDIDCFFNMKDDEYFPTALSIDQNRVELYNLCERMGVGITVMKTFAAGCLLTAETSPFGEALSPAQCISYALSRPAVVSTLIGCKHVEEIRECAAYSDLPDSQKDYSPVISRLSSSAAPKCMYCNHCLPCPSHIDVAQVTRILDQYRTSGMNDRIQAQYAELNHDAKTCIQCGQCKTRCPFGIDIPANMIQAATLFT